MDNASPQKIHFQISIQHLSILLSNSSKGTFALVLFLMKIYPTNSFRYDMVVKTSCAIVISTLFLRINFVYHFF